MRKLEDAIKDSVSGNVELRSANVQAFIARLSRFLDRELPRLMEGVDDGTVDPVEAAAKLGGLFDGLNQKGLSDIVQQIRRAYAGELSAISSRFKLSDLPNALSGADSALIETLINFDANRLSSQLQLYVDGVSSTVMRSVIGGQELDVGQIVSDNTDALASNLSTELNTTLAAFSRSVTAAKAQELGLELFLYVGPDDKVTREFCQDVLEGNDSSEFGITGRQPPIYTKAEIENMDNGQGGDAMTDCGGYNCRHQWAPLSQEEAVNMGYEVDSTESADSGD